MSRIPLVSRPFLPGSGEGIPRPRAAPVRLRVHVGALAAERETKNLNPGKSFNDKYRVSRADYDLMLARAELDLQRYQYAAGRYLQRYINPTVRFDLAGITGPAWS